MLMHFGNTIVRLSIRPRIKVATMMACRRACFSGPAAFLSPADRTRSITWRSRMGA